MSVNYFCLSLRTQDIHLWCMNLGFVSISISLLSSVVWTFDRWKWQPLALLSSFSNIVSKLGQQLTMKQPRRQGYCISYWISTNSLINNVNLKKKFCCMNNQESQVEFVVVSVWHHLTKNGYILCVCANELLFLRMHLGVVNLKNRLWDKRKLLAIFLLCVFLTSPVFFSLPKTDWPLDCMRMVVVSNNFCVRCSTMRLTAINVLSSILIIISGSWFLLLKCWQWTGIQREEEEIIRYIGLLLCCGSKSTNIVREKVPPKVLNYFPLFLSFFFYSFQSNKFMVCFERF